MTNPCCERCDGLEIVHPDNYEVTGPFCKNPACECHTHCQNCISPPNKTCHCSCHKSAEKQHFGRSFFSWPYIEEKGIASTPPTDTCDTSCAVNCNKKVGKHLRPTDTSEEWKERFDEEFRIYPDIIDTDINLVIAFIEKEIERTKQLSFEEGQETMRERAYNLANENATFGFKEGHAAALSKVKEVIADMQFDLTPIEESIAAGMTLAEANLVHSEGYKYNEALTDLLAKLSNLQ